MVPLRQPVRLASADFGMIAHLRWKEAMLASEQLGDKIVPKWVDRGRSAHSR